MANKITPVITKERDMSIILVHRGDFRGGARRVVPKLGGGGDIF
jgi:hypothetical protein